MQQLIENQEPNTAIESARPDQFEKTLRRQVHELFGGQYFSIHLISHDKQSHRMVLADPEADFAAFDTLDDLMHRPVLVKKSIFKKAISTGKSDYIKLARPDKPECESLIHIFQRPPTLIAVPLYNNEEVIGIFSFTIDIEKAEFMNGILFKSVCEEVQVILSNLKALAAEVKEKRKIRRMNIIPNDHPAYLQTQIEGLNPCQEYIGNSADNKVNPAISVDCSDETGNYDDLIGARTDIIGKSAETAGILKLVSLVAPSVSTVLLLGETGTGKELIAKAILNASPRRDQLMVKVNCAALPANLIESELFGHEKGSFTGATDRRIGKFELAHNGTLFLDEIGEMPLDLQVKLLRALQEREIERIGGKGPIKVNVRVIAATNRDLEIEVEQGRFRSDLYYRLNIFPIRLPALRERKFDIPELAYFFMNKFANLCGKKIKGISRKAMQDLIEYNWPGNIRELEHQLERAVLLAHDHTIREFPLPTNKQLKTASKNLAGQDLVTLEENERKYILYVLQNCNGKIAGHNGAASILGIPSSTLNSKMKKLNIIKHHQG